MSEITMTPEERKIRKEHFEKMIKAIDELIYSKTGSTFEEQRQLALKQNNLYGLIAQAIDAGIFNEQEFLFTLHALQNSDIEDFAIRGREKEDILQLPSLEKRGIEEGDLTEYVFKEEGSDKEQTIVGTIQQVAKFGSMAKLFCDSTESIKYVWSDQLNPIG